MQVNLNNLIMFTGSQCSGCNTMKKMFTANEVNITILDVETKQGAIEATKYRIMSLPTFVNTKNGERWSGTNSLHYLKKLNGE